MAIAASVAEEGTTTVACNLFAIALAEADWRVILVEAWTCGGPAWPIILGIEATTGLTSVLTNGLAVKDVLRKWGPGSLSVLLSWDRSRPTAPQRAPGVAEDVLGTLGELEQRGRHRDLRTPSSRLPG